MKHAFLLNENILYHAIKGVDAHDNPDTTATHLLRLIAQNCHSIVLHGELWRRYWTHVQALLREPAPALEPLWVIRQLMYNPDKARWESAELPALPADVTVPDEDVLIVRIALISRPLVVTGDERLQGAINAQPTLGLHALRPREALPLASED